MKQSNRFKAFTDAALGQPSHTQAVFCNLNERCRFFPCLFIRLSLLRHCQPSFADACQSPSGPRELQRHRAFDKPGATDGCWSLSFLCQAGGAQTFSSPASQSLNGKKNKTHKEGITTLLSVTGLDKIRVGHGS